MPRKPTKKKQAAPPPPPVAPVTAAPPVASGAPLPPPVVPAKPVETVRLADLQVLEIEALQDKARALGVETVATLKRHEIIFELLKRQGAANILGEGVLEI